MSNQNLVGTILPNGATVLQVNGEKLLANFYGEFVVWTFNQTTLDTFWGHYFMQDLTGAVDYLNSCK